MKITAIIELSDMIHKKWLEYGIIKGWEDCGCDKCKHLIEAISS